MEIIQWLQDVELINQCNMEYAIRILDQEKRLLVEILKTWPNGEYEEQRKDRVRKLREVMGAIKVLS